MCAVGTHTQSKSQNLTDPPLLQSGQLESLTHFHVESIRHFHNKRNFPLPASCTKLMLYPSQSPHCTVRECLSVRIPLSQESFALHSPRKFHFTSVLYGYSYTAWPILYCILDLAKKKMEWKKPLEWPFLLYHYCSLIYNCLTFPLSKDFEWFYNWWPVIMVYGVTGRGWAWNHQITNEGNHQTVSHGSHSHTIAALFILFSVAFQIVLLLQIWTTLNRVSSSIIIDYTSLQVFVLIKCSQIFSNISKYSKNLPMKQRGSTKHLGHHTKHRIAMLDKTTMISNIGMVST